MKEKEIVDYLTGLVIKHFKPNIAVKREGTELFLRLQFKNPEDAKQFEVFLQDLQIEAGIFAGEESGTIH